MSSRSQEPGKGRRQRVPKWDYLSVPNGGQAVGWKAGPYCGVYVHLHNGSKPCRHITSDNTLSCAWCAAGELPVWRGYCPFYDRDYCRKFVLIGEDYAEAYCEIELHQPIKLQRGKGRRDPVVIRFEQWRTQPLPVTAERVAAVDLFPSLLRVWKDVELEQWHYSSDAPPSLSPGAAPVNRLAAGVGRTVEKPNQKERRSGVDILREAGVSVDEVGAQRAAAARPSANGTGKH